MQHSLDRFVRSSLPLSAALLLTSGLSAQVTWSPVSVGTPPARSAAGAASTLAEHDVLVFGGLGATGALGDTWRYDNQAWTLLSPAASPSPRSHFAMASVHPSCALFGGRDANGAALGDTWIWSVALHDWVPGSAGPAAREGAALAGGPSALLFGGRAGAQTFGDTWRLVPFPVPAWSNVTPATGPSPRHGHALVYVGRNPGPQFNHQLLLVDPVVLVPSAPTNPKVGELWVTVPPNLSLVGAHLCAQAITFLPALGPVSGWVTTLGIDFQLGWL